MPIHSQRKAILWGQGSQGGDFILTLTNLHNHELEDKVSPSSEPRIGWRFWALSSPVLNCCKRTLCCKSKNRNYFQWPMYICNSEETHPRSSQRNEENIFSFHRHITFLYCTIFLENCYATGHNLRILIHCHLPFFVEPLHLLNYEKERKHII